GYVYDTLENTSQERMEGEGCIYGKGMWAASLRYHAGRFYVLFGVPGSGSYLYTAEQVEGPWTRKKLESSYGYLHDATLLFDEDDRVYIAFGQSNIRVTEWEPDFSGLREGGLDRLIVQERQPVYLGHEGSHLYKIRGKYYLFTIHWPSEKGRDRRTQVCFVADSLEGEFTEHEVLSDDMGFRNQGVAQGGIVDTPEGRWYAMLFQDHGAVGRMPVLVPMTWQGDLPVFGREGKVPATTAMKSNRPEYQYEPLYTSDSFPCLRDWQGRYELKRQWQWNHAPNPGLWGLKEEGGLWIRTGKVCINVLQAQNTLTQRMFYPRCSGEVTVDGSALREGDCAGLCALQGCYGMIGIARSLNSYYLVVVAGMLQDGKLAGKTAQDYMPGKVMERIALPGPVVRMRISANFADMADTVEFAWKNGGCWEKVGERHKLYFRLDHFTGCRFALAVYATRESGGEAVFTDFVYQV
ncbi:MAG: family 43 glycosylhydrolase, partial [Acetatifactor sp.]|nr:family 43 glycosylhydrolase [Acetatifactor sp.]